MTYWKDSLDNRDEVLSVIRKNRGISFNEILNKVDMARPTLSNRIKELSDGGRIFCEKDENDKRKKKYYLTEKEKANPEVQAKITFLLLNREIMNVVSSEKEKIYKTIQDKNTYEIKNLLKENVIDSEMVEKQLEVIKSEDLKDMLGKILRTERDKKIDTEEEAAFFYIYYTNVMLSAEQLHQSLIGWKNKTEQLYRSAKESLGSNASLEPIDLFPDEDELKDMRSNVSCEETSDGVAIKIDKKNDTIRSEPSTDNIKINFKEKKDMMEPDLDKDKEEIDLYSVILPPLDFLASLFQIEENIGNKLEENPQDELIDIFRKEFLSQGPLLKPRFLQCSKYVTTELLEKMTLSDDDEERTMLNKTIKKFVDMNHCKYKPEQIPEEKEKKIIEKVDEIIELDPLERYKRYESKRVTFQIEDFNMHIEKTGNEASWTRVIERLEDRNESHLDEVLDEDGFEWFFLKYLANLHKRRKEQGILVSYV